MIIFLILSKKRWGINIFMFVQKNILNNELKWAFIGENNILLL